MGQLRAEKGGQFTADSPGESHLLRDKVDYVRNVVIPLIGCKLIDKEDLARDKVDTFFDKSIEGEAAVRVRYVLPDCLSVVDGGFSHLYDLAKKEVEDLKKALLFMPIKSENAVCHEAQRCIELRTLLHRIIEKCDGKGGIENYRSLLADLDNTFDAYGLTRVMRSFESYSWL